MAKPKLSDDGRTVTVRVPISIRKRGGRKLVLAPDGAEVPHLFPAGSTTQWSKRLPAHFGGGK
jgi:hypothetical protein